MQNLQFDKKITYHERNEDRTYTGRTITVLHIGDTRVFGVSECSIKDQFSRKKGNLVSTSRALRFLEVINGTKVRRITEIAKKNFKKGLMGVFNINDIPTHIPTWMCLGSTNNPVAVTV